MKKYTLICFALPHLTLFASYIPPAATAILVMFEGNGTRQLPERLPYYSWVPFGFDTGPSYLIALGYQAGPMFSYGYSISGMDALCYGLMLCIAGNLAIIQGAFLTIRERSLKRIKGPEWAADGLYNSACLNAAMNGEMRSICRNLQTVLNSCKDLEHLQKYVILAQVSTIQMIICSCLYLVSTVPINSKQFYAEIVYLVAMGIQPFFLCLFGNEVTFQAKYMPDYLWQCDWLAADKKFKKSMIITMARLSKPVSLTAGNFASLTLTTFVSIMKASYSFFTFLKNTGE
ncbi:odorant receptor 94a-like [Anoplophora glabripennis]|uniref:odorant receptor 94a-like n=1 Tax=Anoplophora glabripennis TaxID=217634 RepID=UPI0008759F7B|nr:odorant receptor 94a-like [Anoplophora glabripennis]